MNAALQRTERSGLTSLCLLSHQLVNPQTHLVSCLEAGETLGEECPYHTVGGGVAAFLVGTQIGTGACLTRLG